MAIADELDVMPIRVPVSAATLQGFVEWATSDAFPKNVRASFLKDEVFIDMSPEETETHNKVKTAITSKLFVLSQELNTGTLFSDGVLLTHEDAGLSTVPDAMFVTWDRFRSGQVRLVPRKDRAEEFTQLMGSPSLVVEVISRSSIRKDTRQLRGQYHDAGVLEYWLIDARGEEISFEILLHAEQDYVPAPLEAGWTQSQVFARGFRLERHRDPIGLWQYTLHARE